MNKKHNGALGEIIATAWLLQQGYEVFKNISSHGIIDIVAIKDNVVFKFDVKTGVGARLSNEQIAAGVKLLRVNKDKNCIIEHEDIVSFRSDPINCIRCSKLFKPTKKNHAFCCSPCRSHHYIANRASASQNSSPIR